MNQTTIKYALLIAGVLLVTAAIALPLVGTGRDREDPAVAADKPRERMSCAECQAAKCPVVVAKQRTACVGTRFEGACRALTACYASHGCGGPGGGDPLPCLCGDQPSQVCFMDSMVDMGALGPCAAEVRATAPGAGSMLEIGMQWTDMTKPLGATNQVIWCEEDSCPDACR